MRDFFWSSILLEIIEKCPCFSSFRVYFLGNFTPSIAKGFSEAVYINTGLKFDLQLAPIVVRIVCLLGWFWRYSVIKISKKGPLKYRATFQVTRQFCIWNIWSYFYQSIHSIKRLTTFNQPYTTKELNLKKEPPTYVPMLCLLFSFRKCVRIVWNESWENGNLGNIFLQIPLLKAHLKPTPSSPLVEVGF